MDVIRSFVLGLKKDLLLMSVGEQLKGLEVQEVCNRIWLLDTEIATKSPSEEATLRLHNLIKAYVEADPAARLELMCNTVELETLSSCGLVDLDGVRKALKKKNTTLKYRQTKFNLIREESEGYAKLITELLSDSSVDVTVRNSLALIGYFRLDPNRVLDMVMDSLHHQPDRLCAICAALSPEKSESSNKLESLVRFKLSRMDRVEHIDAREAAFRCIAILLSRRFCSVASLLPQLRLDLFSKICAFRDAKVDKKGKIEEEQELEQDQGWMVVELLDMTLRQPDGWAPTLQLLDAIEGLERHAFRDMNTTQALHSFLSLELSSVYDSVVLGRISGKKIVTAQQLHIQTLDDFVSKYCPILVRIGPEAVSAQETRDCSLMHCVIRMLGAVSKRANNDDDQIVHQVLVCCLLPALTLLPSSNPVISQEIWDQIVSKMPAGTRFGLYDQWRDAIERKPIRPELVVQQKTCHDQVSFALKRFCSDASKNIIAATRLAKAMHGNPFSAFQSTLRQCQVNDNLIPFVTDSLDFCTRLDLDVISFIFCDTLASMKQEKMKEDLTNDALWFKATCQLIGGTFRKCPDMDISPLLNLVFDGVVRKGDVMFLRVLEVLVSSTSLIEIVTEYSKELLESSSGGDTLRLVSFSAFGTNRPKLAFFADGTRDNSTKRFRKLLEDDAAGQTMPFYSKFLLAMASQRRKMLFETRLAFPSEPEKSLKLKSLLFDQTTARFLQMSAFCSTEMTKSKIAKGLPSLSEMLGRYKLEPVMAFHLQRMAASPGSHISPNTKSQAAMATANGSTTTDLFIFGLGRHAFQELFGIADTQEAIQDLYARFWEFTLYDLSLPKARYESERQNVESIKRDLEKGQNTRINSRMIEKTREFLVSLRSEMAMQTARFDTVKKGAFAEDKTLAWREALLSSVSHNQDALSAFFQSCLIPRIMLSPDDASYCARFLKIGLLRLPGKENKLGELEIRIFSTVFSSLAQTVKTSTERETEFLGIFLLEMLEWLDSFLLSSSQNLPGGVATLADYVFVLNWKESMMDCLISTLSSSPIVAYQAMILLSAVKDSFPDTEKLADKLLPVLAKFAGDLDDELPPFEYISKAILASKAQSLIGAVKKRKDSRKLRLNDGSFPPAPPPADETSAPGETLQRQPSRSQTTTAATASNPANTQSQTASSRAPSTTMSSLIPSSAIKNVAPANQRAESTAAAASSRNTASRSTSNQSMAAPSKTQDKPEKAQPASKATGATSAQNQQQPNQQQRAAITVPVGGGLSRGQQGGVTTPIATPPTGVTGVTSSLKSSASTGVIVSAARPSINRQGVQPLIPRDATSSQAASSVNNAKLVTTSNATASATASKPATATVTTTDATKSSSAAHASTGTAVPSAAVPSNKRARGEPDTSGSSKPTSTSATSGAKSQGATTSDDNAAPTSSESTSTSKRTGQHRQDEHQQVGSNGGRGSKHQEPPKQSTAEERSSRPSSRSEVRRGDYEEPAQRAQESRSGRGDREQPRGQRKDESDRGRSGTRQAPSTSQTSSKRQQEESSSRRGGSDESQRSHYDERRGGSDYISLSSGNRGSQSQQQQPSTSSSRARSKSRQASSSGGGRSTSQSQRDSHRDSHHDSGGGKRSRNDDNGDAYRDDSKRSRQGNSRY